MKRISMALVVIGCLTLAALAAEVTSINVVGFVKKELPAGGIILTTCNFDPVGGGTSTLLSVFGTNQLRQDANPLNCDRVILWDPVEMKYQVWAQYTDGKFYKANSMEEWNQGIEGNPEIPPGVGFWLVAGIGAPTRNIVFMGQVVDVAVQSVSIVAGPQIVAYPFTCDIALQDMDMPNDGATGSSNPLAADRILVWLGDRYQVYALYDGDGKWYKANTMEEWNQGILADNIIKMGEGFWYIAQSGFTWTEDSKYLNNL